MYLFLNVAIVITMYEETRMHHLSVPCIKNATYGWIISDFKINDTITILESVILKWNSVVKHHVLKGIDSNTANNIK